MKIAVLSDIHGNYIALEKCLQHAKEQAVDAYIFLGDYLGEFPYPQKTMKILYELKEHYPCTFIRGNKEDYWLNRRKNINCDWKHGNASIGAMKNNYENLTEEDFTFFSSLSIREHLSFGQAETILACHGTPRYNDKKILAGSESLSQAVTENAEKYILCGHSHIQDAIIELGKCVLNPGAVGVAMHTGGHKTQYMLLHLDGNDWRHKFVSLDYDIDTVIEEIHQSGLYHIAPYWCDITIHLMRTGEVAHGTVLAQAMKINEGKEPWYNIPEKDWEKALKSLGIIE